MNIVLIVSTAIRKHTMRASGRPRTWIYRITPQTNAESKSTRFFVSNSNKNGVGRGGSRALSISKFIQCHRCTNECTRIWSIGVTMLRADEKPTPVTLSPP